MEIKGQIFSPCGVKFQSLIKDPQLTWPVQSKVEPSDPLDRCKILNNLQGMYNKGWLDQNTAD